MALPTPPVPIPWFSPELPGREGLSPGPAQSISGQLWDLVLTWVFPSVKGAVIHGNKTTVHHHHLPPKTVGKFK